MARHRFLSKCLEALELLPRSSKRKRCQDIDNDGVPEGPWLENYKDAWDNPINYEWPNTKVQNAIKPAVWSNGPNGQNDNGASDDIVNWDRNEGV